MSELLNSKKFKIAAHIVAVLLIALVSFVSGMKVGLLKARFSYRFGAFYERNFMGPPPPGPLGFMGRGMMDRHFRNAFGLAGKVISVAKNKLVIKDQDNKENTVTVNKETTIMEHHANIKFSDIKKNDEVVVMGKPSDKGVIKADLIRIIDFSRGPM